MSIQVRPFLSEGGWWTAYSDYYRFACSMLNEFTRLTKQIEAEEERITKELQVQEFPVEYFEQYVMSRVLHLHEDAYRVAISCHIYACMALEGFLNLYGVRRLGERFYQRYLERAGIMEKLALVGTCCGQWNIDEHPQAERDFREIFEARNRLVHPKTKEFRPDRIESNLYVHPSNIEITQHMQRLERCVDFFVSVDSTLPRDFLFPKT